MAVSPIILCDFDGTISRKDVTDTLIEHFGAPDCVALEEAWERGEIGSLECLSGQINLLQATPEMVDALLATIEIDESFIPFLVKMKKWGITIVIVSDGLDYAIRAILQRYGIGDIPIIANHLIYDGSQSWHLEFPNSSDSCKKQSGNCKCQQADRLYQEYSEIYYVGDGVSDYCVSHIIDFVYAKGKLIHYCYQQGIEHHPISCFSDILDHMELSRDEQ